MQSREHACELVAALLLVPLSVVGVCLDSPHAQTCTRAGYAHDLLARDGVERLWLQMAILGTFRRRARAEAAGLRGLVHGSTGSNLSRDAAACASRERAVRSRPPLSNVLHTLVEVDVRVAPEPTGSASAAELCLRCAWHELWSVRWR